MAVASRLSTLWLAWLVTIITPAQTVQTVLGNWDGIWNIEIARTGYTALDPRVPFARLAFMPILPISTGLISRVTGLGLYAVGITITTLTGTAGIVLLYRYIEHERGRETATWSMLLLVFAPAGFALGMFYTEGPVLLFVALTFIFLRDRRFELAGLAAMAGSLTRSNGFLLVVPCAVFAVQELRRGGSRRALLAPLLAPVGFIAWIGYCWYRTGDAMGYFRVEEQGWGSKIDGGWATLQTVWDFLRFDIDNPHAMIWVPTLLILGIGGLVLCVRQRLPLHWTAYAAAMLLVPLVNARQTSEGRFLLPAFPLFVAWASVLRPSARAVVLGASAMMMGGIFMAVSVSGVSP
ncbi:MAG: hypothetical protein QOI95_2962 [Acidimicrobiaceae bacterium]|jgi:hypothetical protein